MTERKGQRETSPACRESRNVKGDTTALVGMDLARPGLRDHDRDDNVRCGRCHGRGAVMSASGSEADLAERYRDRPLCAKNRNWLPVAGPRRPDKEARA